jgi:hypothetical protein
MTAFNAVRFRVKPGGGLGVTDPASGPVVLELK